MNDEDLRTVIEKYYNGECSEEEENNLRAFFAKNSPAGFEAEREIFAYYLSAASAPEPSNELESGILGRIDSLEVRRSVARRYVLPAVNIAAGLLILAGTYFFFAGRGRSADTFSDPAIAYAETMKILYSVSSQMNRGVEAMEPVSKMYDLAEEGFKAMNESSLKIEKNLNLFTAPFENAGEQLRNKSNMK